MRVKVQAKLPTAIRNELDRPLRDYPLRLSSFFISACVHGFAIAALLTVASLPGAKPDLPDAPSLTHVSEFLATPDGLTLIAGFVKIRSAKLRRSIVELVSYLAQNQDK